MASRGDKDGDIAPMEEASKADLPIEACCDGGVHRRPSVHDGGGFTNVVSPTSCDAIGGTMSTATWDGPCAPMEGGEAGEETYTCCWMPPAWGPQMPEALYCDYYGGVVGTPWNASMSPPAEVGKDGRPSETGNGIGEQCLWPLEQGSWDAMKDDAFWGGDMSQWQDQNDEAFNQGEWPSRSRSKWSNARATGLSHGEVPRRLNLEAWSKENSPDSEKVTTLMIRNVPNRYDRTLLMQELDELGFQGKYDFVYLPIDNSTQWNVGYAFVNFDVSEDARRCMAMLEGHQFFRFRQNNKRVAQVSVAHIQGLEKNLAHCSGTSLFSLRPWLRPWVRNWPSRRDGRFDQAQYGYAGACFGIGGQQCGLKADEIVERMREAAAEAAEIGIGSLSSQHSVVDKVRRITDGGARRLRILPEISGACSNTGDRSAHGKGDGESVGLPSSSLRDCLELLSGSADLADIEVEVITGIGGEPPFLTTPRFFMLHDAARGLEPPPTAAGRRPGSKAARRRSAAETSGDGDASETMASTWPPGSPWEEQQAQGQQCDIGQQQQQQQPFDADVYDAGWSMCTYPGASDGTAGPLMWTPAMMPGCEMGYYYMQPAFLAVDGVEGGSGPSAIAPAETESLAEAEAAQCAAQGSAAEISADQRSHATSDASASDECGAGVVGASEGCAMQGSYRSDCSTEIGECGSRGSEGGHCAPPTMVGVAGGFSTDGHPKEHSSGGNACNFVCPPPYVMEESAQTWAVAGSCMPYITEDSERGRNLSGAHVWRTSGGPWGQPLEVVRAVSRTPSPSPERHRHCHDFPSHWTPAAAHPMSMLPVAPHCDGEFDFMSALAMGGAFAMDGSEPDTAEAVLADLAPVCASRRSRSASAGRADACAAAVAESIPEAAPEAPPKAKEAEAHGARAGAHASRTRASRRGRGVERHRADEATSGAPLGAAWPELGSKQEGRPSGARRSGRVRAIAERTCAGGK